MTLPHANPMSQAPLIPSPPPFCLDSNMELQRSGKRLDEKKSCGAMNYKSFSIRSSGKKGLDKGKILNRKKPTYLACVSVGKYGRADIAGNIANMLHD